MRAFPAIDRAIPAIEGMHCDGGSRVLIGCLKPVQYGVRVHVPSKTQQAPGHAQVRLTLTLHACEDHKRAGCFPLDTLLTDHLKAQMENFAKKARPIDFKCDFDAAFVQFVDIFSPEYKKFIAAMESQAQHHAREQLWGGPIARRV